MRSVFLLSFCTASLLTFCAGAQTVDWKTLGRPLSDDTKAMEDRFVYFDDSTADRNVSLSSPVLVNPEIQEWLEEYIPQVLTLNGLNYDKMVGTNQHLFTPAGFAEYLKSLQDARIPELLKEQRYKMAVVVSGRPNIFAKGLRQVSPQQSVYVWQAEMPLMLNYIGLSSSTNYKIYLTVELTRIPVREDNTLVAINSWRFSGKARNLTTP